MFMRRFAVLGVLLTTFRCAAPGGSGTDAAATHDGAGLRSSDLGPADDGLGDVPPPPADGSAAPDAPSGGDAGAPDATAPPAERCNSLDDDGDGTVDEDWPELGHPCDGDDDDLCARGTWFCDELGTDLACRGDAPWPERCNGDDDDCDGLTDEDLVDCPDYTKDPVLFVHGYWVNAEATWTAFRTRLIADGWPAEYLLAPSFDDVFGCNPEHGEQIAAWVAQLQAETGRTQVDLLAHSMGAIDVRYYLKVLCGHPNVRDVVMLAGANHGTRMACFEPRGTCGTADMCVIGSEPNAWESNDFLWDLNDCDETPGPALRYTSIWSDHDGVIVPPESSILDGALNIQVQTPGVDHAGIFVEDESYGYVRAGLDGGGRNDNVPGDPQACLGHCPAAAADRRQR